MALNFDMTTTMLIRTSRYLLVSFSFSKKNIYTIYCLPSKKLYTNVVRNHTISCLTQVLGQFAIILIHRDSYRLQKQLRQIIFHYIVQRGLCVCIKVFLRSACLFWSGVWHTSSLTLCQTSWLSTSMSLDKVSYLSVSNLSQIQPWR